MELKNNLQKIGLDLAIFYANPKDVFIDLKNKGFDEVLTSIDFDIYAKTRDEECEKILPIKSGEVT